MNNGKTVVNIQMPNLPAWIQEETDKYVVPITIGISPLTMTSLWGLCVHVHNYSIKYINSYQKTLQMLTFKMTSEF